LATVQVDLGDGSVNSIDFDIVFIGNRNLEDVEDLTSTATGNRLPE